MLTIEGFRRSLPDAKNGWETGFVLLAGGRWTSTDVYGWLPVRATPATYICMRAVGLRGVRAHKKGYADGIHATRRSAVESAILKEGYRPFAMKICAPIRHCALGELLRNAARG